MDSAQIPEPERETTKQELEETIEMSVKGSTRIWTEEAVATLRRLFPTTPSCDIADVIGCSDCTVMAKARQLGLQRSPGFSRNNFIGRYVGKGKFKNHE